jgi:eukaryotic-like serine/threonine-protein kinase
MDARLEEAVRGRYVIERELGAGGMATVWLAYDVKHSRQVAVKVLHPHLAALVGGERFLKEIRTTAQLQHPHILALFDSGDAQGLLYYVMPFVDGESLRQRIDREHQLPVADAVRIAAEVSNALDYAHRHGVIHRDIKPENILLYEGRALVADFGIALAPAADDDNRLTETGLALGTPAYMSPEQAVGERELDARSDVYAVGAVLYEMLTGSPPFSGPSRRVITAKVISHRPVPPSRLRPRIPRRVEETVLTALQKDPADRFATAAGLQAALDHTGATRVRRPHHGAFVAAALIGALAGGLYVATHRGPAPGAPPALSIAAMPFQIQDSSDAYLGDQIPEEILDALTHVPGLTVRPLASAPRFRGERDLAGVANALKVATLLTGSVTREGQAIRITARLYDATRNVSLPTVSFTNRADNKFALEDSVSATIVTDFKLTRTPAQLAGVQARRTANPAAHDTLMLARWYAEQRTPHAMTNAIELFKQAIRLDSTYADAWAGLASALDLRGVFGDSSPTPYFAEAKLDVLHALQLDSNSAYAHSTYGFIKVFHERDYAGARAEFATALRLDSTQSPAWLFQGWAYLGEGHLDSAIWSMRQALRVDPGALIAATRLGMILYFADSMQAAESQLNAVLRIDKDFQFASGELAQVYADEHRCADAMRLLPANTWSIGSPENLVGHGFVLVRCDTAQARAYLDTVEARSRAGGYVGAFFVAVNYAALHDSAAAFRWLNTAIERNDWALFELRVYPAFRPYRADPAFRAILRRAFPVRGGSLAVAMVAPAVNPPIR